MALVLTQAIHPAGLRLLREAPGVEVEVVADFAAAPRLAEAEALIVRKGRVDAAVVGRAAALRLVSRHGVGLDNLDLDALAGRGIVVTDVGDANVAPVAEHALALLLAVAKNLRGLDAAVREGRYAERESLSTTELAGRTVLLLGHGRIGRLTGRLLGALGMRRLVHDPARPAEAIRAEGAEPVSDWRAALPRAEVLSLHLPLTPATRGLVGAAEIAALPRGAMLINTARGGLVDEAALVSALFAGHLRGAGLDVQERSPPPPGSPLFGAPNLVLTPHVAALTAESAERMGVRAARNAADFLAGRLDPAYVVGRRAAAPA